MTKQGTTIKTKDTQRPNQVSDAFTLRNADHRTIIIREGTKSFLII